jgi:hypothetical protein
VLRIRRPVGILSGIDGHERDNAAVIISVSLHRGANILERGQCSLGFSTVACSVNQDRTECGDIPAAQTALGGTGSVNLWLRRHDFPSPAHIKRGRESFTIAATGSVSMGRNAGRKTAKAGGRGNAFGKQGGAGGIARDALRTCIVAFSKLLNEAAQQGDAVALEGHIDLIAPRHDPTMGALLEAIRLGQTG